MYSLALLTELYELTMAYVNPHRSVGLEQRLFDLETKLVLQARGASV